MHHLHPRSRTTSTLFTTTLAISFLVVALPHILPCPVDRRQFADAAEGPDGRIRRRRRRGDAAENGETASEADRPPRECPVPKPTGVMGKMMGFERKEKEVPLQVVIQDVKGRTIKKREGRVDEQGD